MYICSQHNIINYTSIIKNKKIKMESQNQLQNMSLCSSSIPDTHLPWLWPRLIPKLSQSSSGYVPSLVSVRTVSILLMNL